MKKILIVIILFIFTNALYASFSIIVGKDATKDGSVMLAHNEDAGGDRIVNWYKVPRISHSVNENILLKNGGLLAQVEETYGYLWLEVPGLEFSDSYMNEWGVVIASSGCISKEGHGSITDSGIGYFLRKIITERAKTAREGVKLAGEIIEKIGYSYSGRSYCIADPNEGWVLAVVRGNRWVAKRVPDNEVAVVPNYYTIGEVNLKDTLNFLGSADIIEYAIKKGWYDPQSGKKFNFRLAYTPPEVLQSVWNIPRHVQAINLLSLKQYHYTEKLPFSFKPKKKLSIQNIMDVLRNHYEGTQFETNPNYNNGNPHKNYIMRICSETNQYGFVAQLRNWLPEDIGNILWVAPRRPCIQPFIPWYFGINNVPENYHQYDYKQAIPNHFRNVKKQEEGNGDYAFKVFTEYAANIDKLYRCLIDNIKKEKENFEKTEFENQPLFEEKVLKIYKDDPKKAKAILTKYTLKLAMEVLKMTEKRLKSNF